MLRKIDHFVAKSQIILRVFCPEGNEPQRIDGHSRPQETTVLKREQQERLLDKDILEILMIVLFHRKGGNYLEKFE